MAQTNFESAGFIKRQQNLSQHILKPVQSNTAARDHIPRAVDH
jgi:hypothetical protein